MRMHLNASRDHVTWPEFWQTSNDSRKNDESSLNLRRLGWGDSDFFVHGGHVNLLKLDELVLKEIMILNVTWLEYVVRVVKSHKEN